MMKTPSMVTINKVDNGQNEMKWQCHHRAVKKMPVECINFVTIPTITSEENK